MTGASNRLSAPEVSTADENEPQSAVDAKWARPRARGREISRPARLLWQLAIAIAFVAGWQYLPDISALSNHLKFLNRFFISAPSTIVARIGTLMTGNNPSHISIWSYLQTTVVAAVVGVAIGLVLGGLFGLICSNNKSVSAVVRPFIVIANSVPRVALIPIFVVIYGPTTKSSILSVVTIVFFLAFFNAFEGGRNIRPAVIENAVLLGASPRDVMWTIRLPQVIVWTFAVVPNAIAFGIVAAVTTELLTGIPGMGTLLQEALQNADSTLTFAVLTILSVVGLALYWLAVRLESFVTRWQQ